MDQGRVLTALSYSPKILERMLRVFPADRLDDRVEAERFTAREVMAHLADFEQVCLDRIRSAVLKPGSKVDNYDPDARAKSHSFAEKEPFHEAEVFENRRQMTLDYVKSLTSEEMHRSFLHASGVSYTVQEWLVMVLSHDMVHIEQVSAYLATEVAVHS